MKNFIIKFILVLIICTLFFSCMSEEERYANSLKGFKVGILYGDLGNNEGGPNQYAKKGIARAIKQFGIEVVEESSTSKTDRELKLEILARETELIIGIGMEISRASRYIASKYPDKIFVMTGRAFQDENIATISFREEELGYIAGMIAAFTSKTGKIAFIGSLPNTANKNYQLGYSKGSLAITPKRKLASRIGVPEDTTKIIKYWIKDIFEKDYDVLFCATNQYRKEILELAKEYNKYVITINGDYFEEAPNNIIASIVRDFNTAVYNVIFLKAKNELKPENISTGFKEKIEYFISNNKIENFMNDELKNKIKNVEKEIIEGKIIISADKFPSTSDY